MVIVASTILLYFICYCISGGGGGGGGSGGTCAQMSTEPVKYKHDHDSEVYDPRLDNYVFVEFMHLHT